MYYIISKKNKKIGLDNILLSKGGEECLKIIVLI